MKKKKDLSRLPVYEVVINEEDDFSGLKYISLVEDPAIEVTGVAFAAKRYDLQPPEYDSRWHTHPNCNCSFSDGVWSVEPTADGKYPCDICIDMSKKYEEWYRKRGEGSGAPSTRGFSKMDFKVQKDKQIIIGPTMIPDKKIYRQDESGMEYMVTFTADTIRKIVNKFVRENNNRSINLEHTNQMVPAYIMEHWIVEDPIYDKSKIYGFNLPVGTHFAAIKIEDEGFWEREVRGNDKVGFSIEGILGQKLVHMASEKVSFDYHGVLNTEKGFNKAKELIDSGADVHIVTNANKSVSENAIKKVADKLGIPESKIHYAEGQKDEVIKKLGIKKHYDNNSNVNEEIEKNTEANTVKMSDVEEVLLTLTENEILYIMDCYVEPGKGEKQDEFIPRCIAKLVGDEGKPQDQAAAICYSIWENK